MKYSEELTTFVEVARCGSFAEAARSLNLPTTTISRKIQQLESELGVRLFNRTTRSLSLTEVGERLLPKANMVMETIAEFKEEAVFHAASPVGTLYISAPSIIFQLLAPLFSEFLSLYPKIRLEIDSSSRIKDLTAQRADFAFRIGSLADSSLIAIPLTHSTYSLVASKALVEGRSTVTHPTELASWPTIRNHNDGLLLPWRLNYHGEPVDLESEYTVLSDDLSVSIQLVLNGVGLAYLPTAFVKKYVDSGELISLYDEWVAPGKEVHLIYTDKQHLPSKSKEFIRFVRNRRDTIKTLISGQK